MSALPKTPNLSLPLSAVRALAILESTGYETWVVGGWVRDALLGFDSNDIDLCTAATPLEMQAVFSEYGIKTLPTGIEHGTVTALISNDMDSNGQNADAKKSSQENLSKHTQTTPIEITTFRSDGSYSDKRHPDTVTFSRILEDDLSRRDFTINAMAYHPERGLVDIFGGLDDLSSRCIRCVGNPEKRFEEDVLRILRALRFACTYNFSIDPITHRALMKTKHNLSEVSSARLGVECTRLVQARWLSLALTKYKDILFSAIPELKTIDNFAQDTPYHNLGLLEHTARVLEYVQVFAGTEGYPGGLRLPPELGFAALLHDIGKPSVVFLDPITKKMHFYGHPQAGVEIASHVLKRLAIPKEIRLKTLGLIRLHDKHVQPCEQDFFALFNGASSFYPQNPQSIFYELALLREADAVAKAQAYTADANKVEQFFMYQQDMLKNDEIPYAVTDLAVNGNDLIHIAGLESGPVLGQVLNRLLDLVQQGDIKNTRKDLLEQLPQAYTQFNKDRLEMLLFPKPAEKLAVQEATSPQSHVVPIHLNYQNQSCQQGIGLELERFVVNKDTHSRIFFNTGILQFFEAWLQSHPSAHPIDTEERTSGVFGTASNLDYTLTLEPGSQLEISLGPTASLCQLQEALDKLDAEICATFKTVGVNIDLVASGIDPLHTPEDEVPLLPKKRYTVMDAYLHKRGKLARPMMRSSASTQISLDFLGKRRMTNQYRFAIVLAQLLYFYCDTTNNMDRSRIWRDVDPSRCGIPVEVFAAKDAREGYLDWFLHTVPLYLPIDSRELDVASYATIEELFSVQPLTDDMLVHLSSLVFPDVRPKGFLEIRTADAMEPSRALALAAFLKGLFFNETSFALAYALLVEDKTLSAIQEIIPALQENGWDAYVLGMPITSLTEKLLNLAESGLSEEERTYLEPLKDAWNAKKPLSDL